MSEAIPGPSTLLWMRFRQHRLAMASGGLLIGLACLSGGAPIWLSLLHLDLTRRKVSRVAS